MGNTRLGSLRVPKVRSALGSFAILSHAFSYPHSLDWIPFSILECWEIGNKFRGERVCCPVRKPCKSELLRLQEFYDYYIFNPRHVICKLVRANQVVMATTTTFGTSSKHLWQLKHGTNRSNQKGTISGWIPTEFYESPIKRLNLKIMRVFLNRLFCCKRTQIPWTILRNILQIGNKDYLLHNSEHHSYIYYICGLVFRLENH